ncbi:hypothetical protein BH10BDE1_BH10BDE1_04910 [soil metagenome]
MTSALKITIADRFTAEATAWLKSHNEFDVVTSTDPARLAVTEGLIIRSQFKLPKEVLDLMPKLKAVVTATVGFDHIDLVECAARDIKVAHAPNAHTAPAVEMTWALILACARKLKAADKTARSLEWDREPLLGTELYGKTHGIIGLGRIGSRVAKIARAFGMEVVAHDPYRDNEYFGTHQATRVGLDELFHLSDSVSIHVPLTKETKGRINRVEFEFLKPHSIVVNTSRGGVIKEDDLVLHLKAGGYGAFGLDVFTQEPMRKGYELLNFPQVVVTPHIGANTRDAFTAVSMEAARNLVGLLTKGPVSGPLPPQEDWYRAASGLAVSVGV